MFLLRRAELGDVHRMWLWLVTPTAARLDLRLGPRSQGSRKGDGALAAAEISGSACKCIADTDSSIEKQSKYSISTIFFRIRFIYL